MPHKPFVNKKILAHRKDIGEKLRQLRGEKHLTLTEAAVLCGVSVAHISELERGRISPTVNTMFKVANGLNMPISFFLPDEFLTSAQITRRNKQKTVVSENSIERKLDDGAPVATLRGTHVTLERGGAFTPPDYQWTEMIGIVLKGEVKLEANEENHRLKKGDTIHLLSGNDLPSMKNTHRGTSEILWIEATS